MVRLLFLLLLAGTVQIESVKESDMNNLFKLEQQMILNFRNYAKELQKKLRIVKSALSEYTENSKHVALDRELYLSNAFNAFRITRRLSVDWHKWHKTMQDPLGSEEIKMQRRLLALAPKQSTLKKTAQRLQKILKFYNYEPISFLQDNNRQLRLTPADCFYIGEDFFEQRKYHDAITWLTIVTENYTSWLHNDFISGSQWQVYEMKFKAYLQLNMYDEAHFALSNAIHLNPSHELLLKQQQELEALGVNYTKKPVPAPEVILSELQEQCAGPSRQDNNLSCELITSITPFLELAPLRVEDLSYYPSVMLFRNGIYEREIQQIKNAFSSCPSSNGFEENDDISGCFIPDSYGTLVGNLGTRMLDMTGLDNTMDGLYVLEYGSTDAFQPFKLPYLHLTESEQIEAAAILFLNDVDLGGALAIPGVDVVVFPKRGDALVSFNEGNLEHTLCPNVVGTSMVIVKFLFSKPDEL